MESYAEKWARQCEERRQAELAIQSATIPEPIVPQPRYDEPILPVEPIEVIIESVPEAVKDISGPLFDIFKRTVAGGSKPVFLNLPEVEAKEKHCTLNLKEEKKRRLKEREEAKHGREYKPEPHELVLFDIVEKGKPEQLSPYYNPPQLLLV